MRTILLAVLGLVSTLEAQTPSLVKDINSTYSTYRESSKPWAFTTYRDRVYFVATVEATTGTELWSTDNTSAGTKIVADLIPGTASSNPAALHVVNDRLLFTARDVNHGIELWSTDGTAAGTAMLLDMNPGPNSSNPSPILVYKDRLYFVADDGAAGRELWSTDGTDAGTRLVKDLEPGTATSNPRYFVELGGNLYFVAGTGLWKSDGTDAGTVRIRTITARYLAVAGGRIFFEGFTPESNLELWVSDGTDAGTQMVTELAPGNKAAFSSNLSQGFTVLGNGVVFLANDTVHGRELWFSDGTAAGTRMLRDFVPGVTGLWDGRFFYAATFNGRTYFTAEDPEHGQELWVTDGTSAGTHMFIDLGPGSSNVYPLNVTAGNRLLFSGGSAVSYGAKLWSTDGTVEGTYRLRAADGSAFGYEGDAKRTAGGMVYFEGADPLYGGEPWVTDGTSAGTRRIANVAADLAPSSSPRLLTATDGLLYFHADEGMPTESNFEEGALWRTDGTPEGTFKLRKRGSHPAALTGAGSYLLFKDQDDGTTWMRSDGTVEGTKPAYDFAQRFGGAAIQELYPFGDTLFVAARQHTRRLWKTSSAPNAPAVDLGVSASNLVEVAGKYMFYATADSSGNDDGLWITDGTREGTYGVVPALGNQYYGLSPLASAGGTAYFLMQKEGEEHAKLWKSDGTADGTVPVREVPTGSSAVEIQGAGDRVFFATPNTLWTSDGTAEGTLEVAKVHFQSTRYEDNLKPLGNRLVFAQHDADTAVRTLWGSDGTPGGTKMLARLGELPMEPVDGRLYFNGVDEEHGQEIWTTDGTVEGTKLLFDLNPGPGSSDPSEFAKVGNTLYFTAYTDASGYELWALPLTEPRLLIDDVRAEESATALRFTVSLPAASAGLVTADYATSDGTARAGQDYEAASGKLTFAPGETTKTIDVRLNGDTAPENNETLALALSNASGARLVRTEAAGVIDDDDQFADLSVAIEFDANQFDLEQIVRVGNQGPRTATSVDVQFTSVPTDVVERECYGCRIGQIASGGTAEAIAPDPLGPEQVYRSAIARAHQDDPNPSNNAVSWTIHRSRDISMNAAYLTAGASATITVHTDAYLSDPTPTSSNPSIVSISSAVTKHEDNRATFTVTGLAPGTSSIHPGKDRGPLLVTVVAPGTAPRWTGALRYSFSTTVTRVDVPIALTIDPAGAAPLTGATATGEVIVTAFGQELGRATLTGDSVRIPLQMRHVGFSVPIQMAYAGDASFLPYTITQSIYVDKGRVTLLGRLEPSGSNGTYTLKAFVDGAPGVAPTGTVSVLQDGAVKANLTLTPSATGVSTAEMALAGLVDSPKITLQYVGDPLYAAATQDVPFTPTRRRHVRH